MNDQCEVAEPLTPPDCDCRGLPFMPLEVARLLDSDLVALSTGDEFKCAVILWAKSWTQVPAASLPDDDRILARFVGYGLAEWTALRAMALKGWVACSDGRLYHPLIADLAAKAFEKRRGQSDRANSRWAKSKTAKAARPKPSHTKSDATASDPDATAYATAMQGRGTVEGREPPIAPQGATLDLIPEERSKAPGKPDIRVTQADMDAIWEATPRPGRERSSRGEMDKAVKSAAKRGHRPGEVLAGVRGYYATKDATKEGGQYAKGVHRIIAGDRWREFAPPPQDGAGAEGNDRRHHVWMEDFTTAPARWKTYERGPRPGAEGCRVAPEIQRAHGVTPFGQPPLEVGADVLPFPPQPERRTA